MMEKKYPKLKELTGMKIESVTGFKFRHWCVAKKDSSHPKGTMMFSEVPALCADCKNPYNEEKQKAFDKVWGVMIEGYDGALTLSKAQFAGMVEQVYENDQAILTGKRFTVANNGKEGMEIRYWINLVREENFTQPSKEVEEEINYEIS